MHNLITRISVWLACLPWWQRVAVTFGAIYLAFVLAGAAYLRLGTHP